MGEEDRLLEVPQLGLGAAHPAVGGGLGAKPPEAVGIVQYYAFENRFFYIICLCFLQWRELQQHLSTVTVFRVTMPEGVCFGVRRLLSPYVRSGGSHPLGIKH